MAAVVALAGIGLVLLLLLLLRGNGEATSGPGDPKRVAGSNPPPGQATRKPDPRLAAELGAIATAGTGEDVHALDDAGATEAKIASATRRFLKPYLRFELGQPVSPRELRQSARATLVDELLADPPRFPPGLDRRPRPATVTQIAVSGNRPESPSARPRATVIVRLDRAGAPEAAGFTLTRTPDGRWLVTGISG